MDSTDTNRFFSSLPLLESFFEVTDPANFHPLPDDWYVAVTDVENSTEAVNDGHYKSVNILGVSSIIGLLNMTNKDEIPYTFSGDGCALCIPPSLLNTTRKVLGSSRQIGKAEYDLNLRAAIIPIQNIRNWGYDVKVARYKASEVYNQAIFWGGGLTCAGEILKSPEKEQYLVKASGDAEKIDFTGLECRWQKAGQQGKKVITLLVKSNPEIDGSEKVYKDILAKMREILGFDAKTNPIDPSRLTLSMSVKELMGEVKFRTFGRNWLQRIIYFLMLELQIILGKLFMASGYKLSATDWSLYKPDLALNSDHRKFDDLLRLVISGTKEQCKQLKDFLRQEFEDSRLAYGIHITDTAMITCMVFKYHRQHIHFVDGSDGGYVAAAKMLKKQLENFPER